MTHLRLGRSVLGKVLVTVGVHDGPARVALSQRPASRLSVSVVGRSTVADEMRRLVDERSRPRIGTGVGGPPESTTEVDLSELVGV